MTVLGMQNPEPSTSTSRKSTSLVPKRKTTTPKASTIPKSHASKKSSNSPPLPPPRKSSSTNTLMTMQSAFYWFLPCLDLLPVALLFAYVFPGFLVPRCALLFWGIFVRGLYVETFVRVLRSSRCRLLIKCK